MIAPVAPMRPVPVSLVVLTLNEERNLEACLSSVAGWIDRIFVVDSGSTDATVAIARRFGATVVSHPFETHARQWEWALRELPISTDWVLGLDADQRVMPELRDAIAAALNDDTDCHGYYVRRRQIFRGKWIRHGGYYPKYLLKLFRKSHVRLDSSELVDHHFYVDGRVAKLDADIIEDNKNEAAIAVWTAKHNSYAVLQARHELQSTAGETRAIPARNSPDARTRRMKRLWARFPLFVRPALYVFYRYIVRLGFLDGKQGFVFHVLQAFWYRLLVDINIDELRQAGTTGAPVPESAAISTPLARAKTLDS